MILSILINYVDIIKKIKKQQLEFWLIVLEVQGPEAVSGDGLLVGSVLRH